MQKFSVLQINHDLHIADFRTALRDEMTPARALELCEAQVYVPTMEIMVEDGVAIEEALDRCYCAGNGHPRGNDDYQVLVRSHSFSRGDVVREEATGRRWILRRSGWTELTR